MVPIRGGGTNVHVGENQIIAAESQKQVWAMTNIVAKTTIDPWQQVIAQTGHTQSKVSFSLSDASNSSKSGSHSSQSEK